MRLDVLAQGSLRRSGSRTAKNAKEVLSFEF
jgi:hypothetical protein